jgi:hypothetical protein
LNECADCNFRVKVLFGHEDEAEISSEIPPRKPIGRKIGFMNSA